MDCVKIALWYNCASLLDSIDVFWFIPAKESTSILEN